MERDDIIYLACLIFTIIFGHFFKKLENNNNKKWISTVVGFLIAFFVSGKHILHPLICTLVNGFIILKTSRRTCHISSFIFTFLYLFFFRTTIYFGIPYPPNHTNLIQMMLTLKIIGLAFEVHDSHVIDRKREENEIETTTPVDPVDPSLTDIFHFTFCYIGVLTGPYYTYKTFTDYFTNNFYHYAPCWQNTFAKIKYVPIYMAVFLVTSNTFPLSYALTDEFYHDRSFWYRLWYITPIFATFRMRIYIGLVLSECACTMAGLGAYPAVTEPKPGKGPTKSMDVLEKLKTDEVSAANETYNFETIHNIVPWYTEVDPSVRSSIRYWNMCIQYWMAYVVYKRFPSKVFRTGATFAVSAVWHGVYAGYYMCLLSIPFYLPIEDLWEKLFRRDATGKTRAVLDVVYWFVRTQTFSYTGMALILLTLENQLRYFSSIYFVYHFTSAVGLVLGLVLKNAMKKGNGPAKGGEAVKSE